MADTKGDRDEAQRRVVEALAQHSSYLYRASTATSNRIRKIIDEAGQSLSTELLARLDNLTPAELTALSRGKYTTSRLKGVQNAIEAWAEKLDERIKATFAEDGEALAGQEVRYTEQMMAGVLAETAAVSLTASEIYTRALAGPVLGQFVEDMLSEVTESARQQVYSTVRQGIAAGSTNAEIIRALRGTKALQFKDGILQTTRTAAERVVRTGRNHISNVAYEETYQALGVTELVWTSTLDGRVSKVCASRDGERYAVGSNHPRPPAHPNCRSVLSPSFDDDVMGQRPYVRSFKPVGKIPKGQRPDGMIGQVSAKTTYPDWFKRQPAGFQREWLGDKRYRLYREGNYKLERFVDPLGKEYSLAELEARDRETFRQLFDAA